MTLLLVFDLKLKKYLPCFHEELPFRCYIIPTIHHVFIENRLNVESELGLYSVNPVVVQIHVIKHQAPKQEDNDRNK